MVSSELRIGNLIFNHKSEVITVNGINLKGYILIDENHNISDDFCNPIPLTYEWLLKFGFEYSHRIGSRSFYNISTFYIEICFDRCAVYYTNKGELICFIEHVHQLQNLYFALTNTELQYKIP